MQVFVVDKVTGIHFNDSLQEWRALVRWEGYSYHFDTWVSQSAFVDQAYFEECKIEHLVADTVLNLGELKNMIVHKNKEE